MPHPRRPGPVKAGQDHPHQCGNVQATIWGQLLLHQGGASLQQWIHEVNYLDNSLQPLPSILHTAVHKFTPRDADTATLEAMLERSELIGTSAESFKISELTAYAVCQRRGRGAAQDADRG